VSKHVTVFAFASTWGIGSRSENVFGSAAPDSLPKEPDLPYLPGTPGPYWPMADSASVPFRRRIPGSVVTKDVRMSLRRKPRRRSRFRPSWSLRYFALRDQREHPTPRKKNNAPRTEGLPTTALRRRSVSFTPVMLYSPNGPPFAALVRRILRKGVVRLLSWRPIGVGCGLIVSGLLGIEPVEEYTCSAKN
jgi:hypothetical protein